MKINPKLEILGLLCWLRSY